MTHCVKSFTDRFNRRAVIVFSQKGAVSPAVPFFLRHAFHPTTMTQRVIGPGYVGRITQEGQNDQPRSIRPAPAADMTSDCGTSATAVHQA